MGDPSAKLSAPSVNPESLSEIAQELESIKKRIEQRNLSDEARPEIIQAALDVVSMLEKPEHVVMRQAFEVRTS
jgi:hypothetical protein